MPLQLEGKVAIVTGAGGGFGGGIATKFLEEGAKVIAWDLAEAPLQQLASSAPGNVAILVGNVIDLAMWQAALKLGVERFGKVDIVVNNAGVLTPGVPTHEAPLDLFDRMMAIHVKPLYLSAQVFVPHMLANGAGVFVTVASSAGTRPRPQFTFYSASKAAAVSSSKAMAVEYAPTIRFNTISPAVGATQMVASLLGGRPDTEENRALLAANIPMKRMAGPSDVANMACFLASDASSYCTGVDYLVCGGRSV